MRLTLIIFIFIAAPYGMPACDDLIETAVKNAISEENSLSNNDIIRGLKTALEVGADSSVFRTSRLNGFYKDEAIKIMLPPEADIIYDNKDHALLRATGLDKKIEETILALNRAAEDAASMAAPVFKQAITEMSISDGRAILQGKVPGITTNESGFDSTAATSYLKNSTYTQLETDFIPVVSRSLDKKLIGNRSPNELWNYLSVSYNQVADKSFGMIKPMQNTDLGKYVTHEALEGLFLKVGNEEIKIRRNPGKWAETAVGNILKRVFGK